VLDAVNGNDLAGAMGGAAAAPVRAPPVNGMRDTDESVLRVFAYGSLMWDGWENGHGCLRRAVADVHGYRRGFTKASVRNWGTRRVPGPTLNLAPAADGVCRGIVFEFAGGSARGVRDYLAAREGTGFELCEVRAHFLDGSEASVATSIYRGGNTIEGRSLEEIAAMVVAASGTSGRCIDYVRALSGRLAALGIDDPAVTGLWERLHDE